MGLGCARPDDLLTGCDSAIRGFWGERSPEIPLAIDATHELRSSIRGLADQLASLGAACGAYADHVEAKRAEILHLAEWLLEQVVEGVLISVAIGAVTGGAGTAAGLSAVAARVAAESPRFAAILEALRTLAAGVAASVRAARDALQAARVTLTKFKDATVARSVARGEAGTLKLWWERDPGWLAKHEHSGSHTRQTHIRRTDEELKMRFSGYRPPPFASTFPDVDTAERAIGEVLSRHAREVEDWLDSGGRRCRVEDVLDWTVGRSMDPSGMAHDVAGVRVVLDVTRPCPTVSESSRPFRSLDLERDTMDTPALRICSVPTSIRTGSTSTETSGPRSTTSSRASRGCTTSSRDRPSS